MDAFNAALLVLILAVLVLTVVDLMHLRALRGVAFDQQDQIDELYEFAGNMLEANRDLRARMEALEQIAPEEELAIREFEQDEDDSTIRVYE